MKKTIVGITMLILMCSLVVAVLPDPGHTADSIGAGTFGSLGSPVETGTYTFPSMVKTAAIGDFCIETGPCLSSLSSMTGGNPNYITYWNATDGITYDSELYWNPVNNRMGIGTTNPQSKLSVGANGLANTAIFGEDSQYGVYGSGGIAGITGASLTGSGIMGVGSLFGTYGSGNTGGVKGAYYPQYTTVYGILGHPKAGAFMKSDVSGKPGLISEGYNIGIVGNATWIGSGTGRGVFGTADGQGVRGKNLNGNFGYLGSGSYGAYGKHDSSTRYGYLGGLIYGVYGRDASSSRYGYLGSANYGTYGQYDSTHYGYLGGSTYGVFGKSSQAVKGENVNNANIYGILGHDNFGVAGANNENFGTAGQFIASGTGGTAGYFLASGGSTATAIDAVSTYFGVKGTGTGASGYGGIFTATGGGASLAATGTCGDDGGPGTPCKLNDIAEMTASKYSTHNYDCQKDMIDDTKYLAINCRWKEGAKPEFDDGHVVCLDPKNPQMIQSCNGAYDNSVLSVVSEHPTMVMGNGPGRAYPLSLAGNIPVKVKCDKPIAPGDLLVTAKQPGYAMKLDLDDRNLGIKEVTGTVFAKATENCERGEAVIRAWMI